MNHFSKAKVTLLSILCIYFFLPAVSYAQADARITVNRGRLTLREALQSVEEQSSLSIAYNESRINDTEEISLDITSRPLDETLRAILAGTGFTYRIKDNYILIIPEQQAEPHAAVTGTVTDKSGQPLVGASVVLKGTTKSVVADIDGKFHLTGIAQGQTLAFSYLGYNTVEITVDGRTVYNVTLEEEAATLDEVVVTALGIRRTEKALSYHVQKVPATTVTLVNDASFIKNLAGKVAGVQINSSASGVGGSSRVVMRGTKSLFGENNALYALDGIPLQNLQTTQPGDIFEMPDGGNSDGIADLNPDDIEDISVLTGAAAAALYGSGGSNGVIIITTKKGVQGRPRIAYSNSTQFLSPFVMPQFQNRYGSATGDFYSWGHKLYYPSTYEPKDFFQTGYNETNSLSVSAGTERHRIYVSGAYVTAEGIIPNNEYNRFNITANTSSELVKDKLTLDLSLRYINQYDKNGVIQGQYHNPLIPVYLFPRGDDMAKYRVFERYDAERHFKTQYWPYGAMEFGMQNPYWIINRESFENSKDRFIAGANLHYRVTGWLSIAGRIRLDRNERRFTRKLSASTSQLYASDCGNYALLTASDRNLFGDVLASINRQFDNWSLQANVGASINDAHAYVTGYEGHLARVPNLFHISNVVENHAESKQYEDDRRIQTQSVYATAEAGYRSMVFLNLTGRADWPSQLSGANQSGYFYPSVGLSGVISEMADLRNAGISFFKVRASYSEVGNAPQPYITKAGYGVEGGMFINQSYLPATGLTPEKTKSFEAGMNIRFFDSRLQADATYYYSNTYNQLFSLEPAASTGYTTFYINGGKVNNWGIEAMLSYDDTFGKVQWTSTLTCDMNRNEIKELVPSGTLDPSTGTQVTQDVFVPSERGSYRMALQKGGTMGDLYVSTLKKDEAGYTKVDANTSSISSDPQHWVKAGSVMPKFHLGWNNTVTYRNFSLSCLIAARVGGVGVSVTQAIMDRFGVSEQSAAARDKGGVPVNGGMVDAEKYYRVTGGGATGVLSEYVYSATNVRIKEVSLGYTFPGKFFNDKIAGLSVALTANNLFMIYCKAPFDPELTPSTATYYQGLDYFMQPSLRSIGFNVKFHF
jgi:TonB-linked SusC/RagA family outer membrane protein